MNGLLSRISGKKNESISAKYNIGNAQTIGKMEFQSNYFATALAPNLLAVMADGGIDHINGRRAAIIAVESIIAAFSEDKISNEHYFIEVINETALRIIQKVKDSIYNGKMPSISLSVICFFEDKTYFFSVGNIRILVYDNKKVKDINVLGQNSVYNSVKQTDNFAMVSQGVYESLSQVEIYRYLLQKEKKYGHSDERVHNKAIRIIEEINKKNLKNAKNATVVLFEGEV